MKFRLDEAYLYLNSLIIFFAPSVPTFQFPIYLSVVKNIHWNATPHQAFTILILLIFTNTSVNNAYEINWSCLNSVM